MIFQRVEPRYLYRHRALEKDKSFVKRQKEVPASIFLGPFRSAHSSSIAVLTLSPLA
jgi:hypothetical protein